MTTLTIPVSQVEDFPFSSRIHLYSAIAPLATLPTNIPLDANLRVPDKDAPVVVAMLKTLSNEADRFLFKNQGIKIVAEELKINRDELGVARSVTLKIIKTVQGIEDGGHSLCAIELAHKKNLDLTGGYVKLSIRVGVASSYDQSICVGLNTSRRVDSRSKLNKLGVFDILREKLENVYFKEVQYHQSGVGFDKRCSINHIMKILLCLDRNRFNYLKNQHPIHVVDGNFIITNKAISTCEKSFDNLFIDAMKIEVRVHDQVRQFSYDKFNGGFDKIPGVKEAVEIKDYSKLANGLKYPLIIPSAISLPIIASMRPMINYTNYSWLGDFDSFGMDLVMELWKPYLAHLRKAHKEGKRFQTAIASKELYSTLCAIAQEFRANLAA